MASKTDTEVIIGGRVFTLCGYESEEYLQKVASYINNKLVEYGKVDSFRRQNGSIVCRELLGLTQKSDCPIPESRNDEYYKKRPCGAIVYLAAKILEDYLKENNCL